MSLVLAAAAASYGWMRRRELGSRAARGRAACRRRARGARRPRPHLTGERASPRRRLSHTVPVTWPRFRRRPVSGSHDECSRRLRRRGACCAWSRSSWRRRGSAGSRGTPPRTTCSRPGSGCPLSCPCCGHPTLSERGADERCRRVRVVRRRAGRPRQRPVVRGGPNGCLSLDDARLRYLARGGSPLPRHPGVARPSSRPAPKCRNGARLESASAVRVAMGTWGVWPLPGNGSGTYRRLWWKWRKLHPNDQIVQAPRSAARSFASGIGRTVVLDLGDPGPTLQHQRDLRGQPAQHHGVRAAPQRRGLRVSHSSRTGTPARPGQPTADDLEVGPQGLLVGPGQRPRQPTRAARAGCPRGGRRTPGCSTPARRRGPRTAPPTASGTARRGRRSRSAPRRSMACSVSPPAVRSRSRRRPRGSARAPAGGRPAPSTSHGSHRVGASGPSRRAVSHRARRSRRAKEVMAAEHRSAAGGRRRRGRRGPGGWGDRLDGRLAAWISTPPCRAPAPQRRRAGPGDRAAARHRRGADARRGWTTRRWPARSPPGARRTGAGAAGSTGSRARPPAIASRSTAVRLDCDGDTVLLQVDQEGPACHTGRRTCFDADLVWAADPAGSEAAHG